MKLSLSVQTLETPLRSPISLLTGSLDEMAAKAAAWGADGIELMPVEVCHQNPEELSKTLAKHHLEISAVGTALFAILGGLTLLHSDSDKADQALELFHQTIDFAAALGAPLVIIGGFRGRFSASKPEGKQKFIDILRQTAEAAAPLGVRLVIEPINRYQSEGISSAAEGLRFLEEVNHPAVGLLIDTCHMTMEESSWTDPFRQVISAGKLWHVHIADSNRLPPGRGLVAFPDIIKTLEENGYEGHLSLEVLAKPEPDTAAREGLEYLRRYVPKQGAFERCTSCE
jgi:5-keto-L-gluconate epimerase